MHHKLDIHPIPENVLLAFIVPVIKQANSVD